MIRLAPFWYDDAPRPLPVSEPPATTGVAIVGGGFTGLNAARELLRCGAEPTVLEAGAIGEGASGRNGGMVNYGLKRATTAVFDVFGPQLGREFWQASLRSIDLVEEIIKDEGIDCAFVRAGAAELGYRSRDRETFEAEAEWMAANVGFETEVLGPDRIQEVIDSSRFQAAQVDTVGAGLQPARYLYGLVSALGDRGVPVVENARVESIRRNGTRYAVETRRGTLMADQVLIATNGYTGSVVPRLRRKVVPIGSYIVVTEPLPADVAERLIPRNRMMWTARRFLNYFRRTPDNRILMGGRNDLRPDRDLVESAAVLRATTADIFPELAGAAVTHSWTGRLGITFDLMPHIGRVDGVWYALGYGGHGVGIGTYVGSEVGRLMAGDLDRSPFAEIPHPGRFYYRGRPWFLPLAARWYRFLDRIGR